MCFIFYLKKNAIQTCHQKCHKMNMKLGTSLVFISSISFIGLNHAHGLSESLLYDIEHRFVGTNVRYLYWTTVRNRRKTEAMNICARLFFFCERSLLSVLELMVQ